MKLTKQEFLNFIYNESEKNGYTIEIGLRNKLKQIVFNNKKLHEKHLIDIFNQLVLNDSNNINENISIIIERIASGRPCTHKPMREILNKIPL